MFWEHKGDVVWVFGQRALPTDVITAALGTSQPTVEVVSTKHFCRDLQRGGVVNAAWVGLLHEAEGTCTSASGGDGDVAGATCMQRIALSALLHEFDDVFQAPTKPPAACVKHWINLINPDQHILHFRTYRTSASELDELKCEIDDMLEKE